MSLMCFLFLWLFQLFFLIAGNGREGFLLSSICFFFFLLFFCRGEGYFNSLVGRVRDSSSAGHSMTYVLGAFNSFVGGWVDFGCN